MDDNRRTPTPPLDSLPALDMILGLDMDAVAESQGDAVAVSQSTVAAKGGNEDANFGVGDVTDEACHTNVPAVEDSQDQGRIEQRAKRRRFTYSKRKVLADYQLFIKDDEVVEWRLHKGNDWRNHRIMGQITGCPTKKNGNVYTLKWEID